MDEKRQQNRRNFIKNSALTLSAFTVIPRHVLGGKGFTAPSSKLNMACIGVGGKGRGDVKGVSSENIVALCDVDQKRAQETFGAYPDARRYEDFREMFDKETDIDAVTISTPDHTHAAATMEALKRGMHVYTQKPLTRTIAESRELETTARKKGVATQMGNQGHSKEGPRIVNELIWQGAIGTVRKVHCWTDRPIWPQGIKNRPESTPPVPSHLNWDLWLGPAPYREYHPDYLPFKWRAWWDFGCGALGDMGCHIIDFPFWALKLNAPTSVEGYSSPVYEETAPVASMVTYNFKSGLDGNDVELIWYDGGLKPTVPKGLKSDTGIWNSIGCTLFEGDEGKLVYGYVKPKPVLLKNGKEVDYELPKEIIPRSPGHYEEWINECKGSDQRAMSNFDYAGPLNETVLLGNVALRTGQKIQWDAKKMKVTNVRAANKYINEDYRRGWSL